MAGAPVSTCKLRQHTMPFNITFFQLQHSASAPAQPAAAATVPQRAHRFATQLEQLREMTAGEVKDEAL